MLASHLHPPAHSPLGWPYGPFSTIGAYPRLSRALRRSAIEVQLYTAGCATHKKRAAVLVLSLSHKLTLNQSSSSSPISADALATSALVVATCGGTPNMSVPQSNTGDPLGSESIAHVAREILVV